MSTALSSFTPTAQQQLPVGNTTQSLLLSTTGSPTLAVLTNLSTSPIFVLFGASGVVVTSLTGMPIPPNQAVVFNIGGSAAVAAINGGGPVQGTLSITLGN